MPKKVLFFAMLCLTACSNVPSLIDQADEIQPVNPATEQKPVESIREDITTTIVTEVAPPPVAPPDKPLGLWQLIANAQTIDIPKQNARIEAEIKWHQRNPAYLQRVSKRATPYLQHIVTTLQQKQMPLELALLPIVESAYDPFAYSSGQAAGLWQFIPGTAKDYGIDMNWWYDGRRDPLDATDAATSYLAHLHQRFNSWPLALAAYNCGQGKLSRVLGRASSQTMPWDLALPKETKAYVPKWLALIQIVRDPERYKITLPKLNNEAYFATVELPRQLDLAQAATLLETDLGLLYKLNPGLSQWSTPPRGPHRLHIPAQQQEQFETKLKLLPKDQFVAWKRYQIKSGDSLSVLAKRFNTTTEAIKRANRLRNNGIRANQFLLIPTASAGVSQYGPPSRKTKPQNVENYIVKSGDSFWSIARNYPVTSGQLAKLNNLSPKDTLRIGQRINVPISGPSIPLRSVSKKINYRVRNGDSLFKIAQRFKVSVKQISNWNRLDQQVYLQPGQRLVVYVDTLAAI